MWVTRMNRMASMSIPPRCLHSTAASVGGPEIAQDYISRGWDYLNYKRHLHFQAEGTNTMDIDLDIICRMACCRKASRNIFPGRLRVRSRRSARSTAYVSR